MMGTNSNITDNERLELILNRKPIDRVPLSVSFLSLGFSTVNVKYEIKDYYYDAEKSFESQQWTPEMYAWIRMPSLVYGSFGCMEFGGELKTPQGEFVQSPLPIYPVTTEEDGWNLKKPDFKSFPGLESVAVEIAKKADQRGDKYIFCFIEGAWTTATMIAGVDNMVRWSRKRKDLANHILKLTNAYVIEKVQWYADTFGAERVIPLVGHASATNQIIGPNVFEEFCLPYILEQYKAHLAAGCKHILCHICGYQALNYPMWAQVPMGDPGIISVSHDVSEEWQSPLECAGKFFPNDILYGNIEPAKFQVGRPEEIYKLCEEAIKIGKKHEAGFILSTGCELPPFSSPYNVWMMTKAINDFGSYK